MKHNDHLAKKKQDILHHLCCLPRRMLQLYGRENVAEFILHELGKQNCFNLERAAYIIDNPDFNCLKGVAGYAREEELSLSEKDIWDDPDAFSDHMKNCSFNCKVRELSKESCVKKGLDDKRIVEEVAADLGFENPSFYAWPLKNDNHGILLYQKHEQEECDCNYLLDGLCLIGFCPVF